MFVVKKFVYQVASWEFVDFEAFGKAWNDAKDKATELHKPIYRLVINDEDNIKQEVFCKGGCFVRVDLAKTENGNIEMSQGNLSKAVELSALTLKLLKPILIFKSVFYTLIARKGE